MIRQVSEARLVLSNRAHHRLSENSGIKVVDREAGTSPCDSDFFLFAWVFFAIGAGPLIRARGQRIGQCRFETITTRSSGDRVFFRMHGRRAGSGNRCSRASVNSRHPRPSVQGSALRIRSAAPRLTFVLAKHKPDTVHDLDQGSGRIPAVPTTSAEKPSKRPIIPEPVEANTDAVPKNVITAPSKPEG